MKNAQCSHFLLTYCSVFSLFKLFPKGIAVQLHAKVNVSCYIPGKYELRYLSYLKKKKRKLSVLVKRRLSVPVKPRSA